MNKALLVVAVLMLGLTSACSKERKTLSSQMCADGDAKDFGIIGGQTVSKDAVAAKSIVALMTKVIDERTKEEAVGLCSGTLIAPNVILTAAHCVENRIDDKSIAVAFTVAPSCEIAEAGKTENIRISDKIIVHDTYGAVFNPYSDLALIRFSGSTPAGYQPMSLIFDQVNLSADQKVFLAGFGSEVDYNYNRGQVARLKYATVYPFVEKRSNRTDMIITKNNAKQVMSFDQRRGEGACAGDSGGPSMLMTPTGLKLLGVASQVQAIEKDFEKQSDVTCRQGVDYTSVSHYGEWIKKNTLLLLGKGSSPVPR